jgi:putative hemolysin
VGRTAATGASEERYCKAEGYDLEQGRSTSHKVIIADSALWRH